jgi:hypothetical protein
MNYPYPRFFLDIQLAKKRFAQVWTPEREVPRDSERPPTTRSAPVENVRKEPPRHRRTADKPNWSCARFPGSGLVGLHLRGNRPRVSSESCPYRNDERGNSDMTPFCFTLTLVLVGTVAAAHTDLPAFWLLAGPAPLVTGFMAVAFFRQGFGRHGPGPILGVPGRPKHDDRKMAQHISPTESCRMMQKSG